MGLKYTKRAMTSYEVHRFFHGLEISFFPDTLKLIFYFELSLQKNAIFCKLRIIFIFYLQKIALFYVLNNILIFLNAS